MSFFEKLTQAIATYQTLLIICLDPNPEMMPQAENSGEGEEGLIIRLETWLKSVIQQTSGLVCAYKPTLGFYEAFGGEGLDLLLRVIKAIPEDIPIILDAKHGDINTSTIFAQTIFEKWQVDAVTVSPYAGQDHVAPFLVYPDKGVFVLCHTSNPGAVNLQEYPTDEAPFYLQVIKEAKTWGTLEQLFLEVGTSNLDVIRKIRGVASERFLLLRSIWSKGNDITSILKAGLNQAGEGVLIPVPQDFLKSDNLREQVTTLKGEINQLREQIIQESQSCELWSSNVCLLSPHPYQDLILQLYDIGCLLFGEYVQASGATFSYYVDLRKIISQPQLFHQVLSAYGDILKRLNFDRIAGIPYGALPTATGLSLMLHHPMIYPRKEVKAHGTRRLIEGNFHPGEKVVVIDDILITGKSVREGAEKLKSSGLIVEDIVVFIDHEEGVHDKLKEHGYQAYSVLKISEITETLYKAGRINEKQYQGLAKH
ncbi:bifunctional orotidine-5'-phosphate decarboxylase/orotate phosphoribosyltransferase [Crocosphaera sp. XPORK-15E]|uniref:bifunctional orotidine-5'-phosphate decarboxylase/orotate phosphoribosyltransferase n=1 Tax=Crocosphaera sp. XPORK-15E TaxID=3110247 RepID=UPI002B1F90E3|nr:bifunctional orotidine-5'-phosphate decarboxylase/orotate phosphoribosyltransferase [Crocosphaera sp. XPORK-15E]MEA5534355.1 bifunctional orotidine-5'-phosphate decarboxylase/orotate phosphoribosyltransferase [Crocosphaera sp. XPORK-15E]